MAAFATNLPEGSVTTPFRRPVVEVWAKEAKLRQRTASARNTDRNKSRRQSENPIRVDDIRSMADLLAFLRKMGAFALAQGSADSALLLTLQPGSYTAEVAGVGGTTGIALVEVYQVLP